MQKIDKAWWQNVLANTENLREPIVLPQVFENEVDTLSELTVDIFRKLASARGTESGFRVWVSDEHGVIAPEPTKAYDERLCTNPPLPGESIAQWGKRIFGDRKFGIIMNDGQLYSAEMNQQIARKIQPLLDLIGMPLTGVSTTYFVGNYGYTPLGIHQDRIGEDVFHFHLGPGPKVMYTWDEELYKSISGVMNNRTNIEELLPAANKYPFEAGDIFFMPWDKYHVGYSDEISLGLTMWINNPTPAFFIRKLARSILGEITPIKDRAIMLNTVLSPDSGIPGDPKLFEELAPYIQVDETMADLSLQEFMQFSIESYRLGLLSNGGFVLLQAPEPVAPDALLGQTVQLTQPFKIFHTVLKHKIFLFVRGYRLSIAYHPALPALLARLNTGEPVAVADLIEPLLGEWTEEVARYVVALLLSNRGIELAGAAEPAYAPTYAGQLAVPA
jgi:hypothetical protein